MVKITIEGPGSTIWHEMHTVKKALESVGYEVEVHDEYPVDFEDRHTKLEDWAMEMRDRMKEHKESIGEEFTEKDEKTYIELAKKKVKLEAIHLPWGG